MSNSIRVNKVLRKLDLSIEDIQDLFDNQNIRPTSKIHTLEYNELSTEELIDLKNDIHRILLERIDSLKKKVEEPELYAMQA